MQENTNNVNTPPNMDPNLAPQEESSAGPVIGTIIILAVIVLGGLYFWGQRVSEPVMTDVEIQGTIETIEEQSTSDALVDIEADLNATDIEDIDSQLNDI